MLFIQKQCCDSLMTGWLAWILHTHDAKLRIIIGRPGPRYCSGHYGYVEIRLLVSIYDSNPRSINIEILYKVYY